jgi:hypothetical protein
LEGFSWIQSKEYFLNHPKKLPDSHINFTGEYYSKDGIYIVEMLKSGKEC